MGKKTHKKIQTECFEVDQRGIDDLKNRCFNEAKEFSYFKKGNWAGILASIENAELFQSARPGITMTPVAAYPGARELAKDVAGLIDVSAGELQAFLSSYVGRRKRKNHICRRVICSSRVNKARIAEWEAVCGYGGVATIPESQVGPFTYVVSDRMWAIFTRFGKNDLRGVQGRDQQTIMMLRICFDREFAGIKMTKPK